MSSNNSLNELFNLNDNQRTSEIELRDFAFEIPFLIESHDLDFVLVQLSKTCALQMAEILQNHFRQVDVKEEKKP